MTRVLTHGSNKDCPLVQDGTWTRCKGHNEEIGQGETISFRTWNQGQSWNYERIVNLQGHKLKVTCRHSAYKDQSYSSIQRWDGVKWQHVETISGALMESWNCQHGLGGPESQYITKMLSATLLTAFGKDEEQLLEIAAAILL